MITKAIIKSKVLDSNKYYIRVPYFEQANINNSSSLSSYFEATVAQIPGIVNAYSVDDVVFVAFEDHHADKPVIIGKLSLQDDIQLSSDRGFANLNTLSVSKSARLPNDTTIGDFSFKDFNGTLGNISNLSDRLSMTNDDIADIETQLSNYQSKLYKHTTTVSTSSDTYTLISVNTTSATYKTIATLINSFETSLCYYIYVDTTEIFSRTRTKYTITSVNTARGLGPLPSSSTYSITYESAGQSTTFTVTGISDEVSAYV